MNNHISADKPVASQTEDKFQRYEFSKRIARTILDRESDDCLVIGIYGAWGEGKSSVLNFIEHEIGSNAIVFKFNPWRYENENSLLIQFFQQLATNMKAKLKSGWQEFGGYLKKYGNILNVDIPGIGNFGEGIQAMGQAIDSMDVEALKNKISELIVKHGSKIVVIIDDIDRLDKTEIHSIFRLVKLTGDFARTTYILSFDEEMVSAAIGERFGAGNLQAGQQFLEKIIQVPLTIPVAQPEALRAFCFDLLNRVTDANGIDLSQEESQRYITGYIEGIQPKLETPRLAVRYGNSLSFSLPLLKGEVNIVDLMLIEAVKVFYPNIYEFIKNNPSFFIGKYQNNYSGKDDEKIKDVKLNLEKLSAGLTKQQKSGLESLLQGLFPSLEEAYSYKHYSSDDELKWLKHKRIASPNYFNRFFSYAVLIGEISDIAFQNFLSSITRKSDAENIADIEALVSSSNGEHFIQKIRMYETDFEWATGKPLAQALSKSANLFSTESNSRFFLNFANPRAQVAIFTSHIIHSHNNHEEASELVKNLIVNAQPFTFGFELIKWLKNRNKDGTPVFATTHYMAWEKTWLERAKSEAENAPLFLAFPDNADHLYEIWAALDKEGLDQYSMELLSSHPEYALNILKVFMPTVYSSAYPEPFKASLSKDQFDWLISIFDKELIKTSLLSSHSQEEIDADEIVWNHRNGPFQNDLNMIRQFLHWDRKPTTDVVPE